MFACRSVVICLQLILRFFSGHCRSRSIPIPKHFFSTTLWMYELTTRYFAGSGAVKTPIPNAAISIALSLSKRIWMRSGAALCIWHPALS